MKANGFSILARCFLPGGGASYFLQRMTDLKIPSITHVALQFFSLSIVVLPTLSLASGQGRGLEAQYLVHAYTQ